MHNQMAGITLEKQTTVETKYTSETGPVREHNEDRIAVVSVAEHGLSEKGILFIVADGMGGMEAGEQASTMVVNDLPAIYLEAGCENPVECLKHAVMEINRRVHEAGEQSGYRGGIGTTVVASVVLNDHLVTINVGDSRAYLLRNGKLTQLTKDHSIQAGIFSPFDGREGNLSHVLTQAIGPRPSVTPYVNGSKICEGDMIVLCSDGLTSFLSDIEIEQVLNSNPFDRVVDELIARVFDKKGDDNVSIILSRVVDVVHESVSETHPSPEE